MRVVYVTHQYPPNYNTGTELYAKRLALRARGTFGHDVRIFTFEPSWRHDEPFVRREETVDEGVPVTRVCLWNGFKPNPALGQYYDVFPGKIFGSYLDQVRPDVVHVFHTAFHGASVLEETFLRDLPTVVNLMDFWFLCPTAQLLKTRTLARCTGPAPRDCLECLSLGDFDFERLRDFAGGEGFELPPPEIGTVGDGRRWNQPSPYAAFTALLARPEFLRRILLRADRIVAPSETLRAVFARLGYDERRIEIVRYGVDPMPAYTFDRRPAEELRVGFIGTINRPKGLHLLIEAMLGLAGKWTLDVFGNTGAFPHYAEECVQKARGEPRIRFRGAMKPEHAPTALRDVDVLVVPSMWQENTPFVVLEAKAAGVPVVGADVEGIAEVIRDGFDGRLFQAGDAASLRAVLSGLVEDRAAVARLTGHFADARTLLANVRDFIRIYEELAALRRARPEPVPGGGWS